MRAASHVTESAHHLVRCRRRTRGRVCARLGALGIDRLRLLGDDVDTDGHDIRLAAHAAGVSVDDAPPVGAPEIELPRWLREQTVTTTMHRHGRLLR